MSVDFSWERLDESLATHLVEALNRHLQTVTRPSFIGPVEVTAFEFGSACPDVEIVDMRDIYRDFLEDDEDDEVPPGRGPDKQQHVPGQVPSRPRNTSGSTTGTFQSRASGSYRRDGKQLAGEDEDEEYEWVSRRSTRRAMAQEAPAYHHLPPHMRYGRPPSGDFLTSLPGMHTPRDIWSSAGMGAGGLSAFGGGGGAGVWGAGAMSLSVPNMRDALAGGAEGARRPGLSPLQGVGVGIGTGKTSASMYAASARSASSSIANTRHDTAHFPPVDSPGEQEEEEDSPASTPPLPNTQPNLQLHFHIVFHSDLRLSLTTSLLINYPSPMFMALPIKLSVIGLVFDGEVVVAYEGQRKRVHFCVLDDLDPYGPAADRHNRPERRTSASSTPPEGDDEEDADEMPTTTSAKPLPIGQRLLPSIMIESEIGQVDKHVLKNVPRVEKFIQDVIRKTVEDELVFPNFHTLILGD